METMTEWGQKVKNRLRRTLGILTAAALIVGMMVPASAEEQYSRAFDKFIVSAGECVNVRKEPRLDSEIVAEIYPGQVLESIQVVPGDKETEDGTELWYRVSLGEGATGYTKYDYFLHGQALQDYLMATGRIYADIKENTEATIYQTTEKNYGKTQDGPTGELYNVLCVWNGLLELDGLGFVDGEQCELTLISEEEKAAREAELLAADLPEMESQLASDRADWQEQQAALAAQAAAQVRQAVVYSAVTPETTPLRAAIVAEAQSHAGLSYVWGGTSLEKGVDCSGLTMRVYEKFGISIGRTTRQQAVNGTEVDVSRMQPGDLVFYADEQGRIYHVVMYVGEGMCVHARSEQYGVLIEPLPGGYSKVVSFVNE